MPKKFDEDFDDDKFEDEEAEEPKVRGAVKQEEDEEQEEEKPVRLGRPPIKREEPPIREDERQLKQRFAKSSEEDKKPRFSAYHITERVGVLDNKTEKPIGEDLMVLIADIKNDLDEIKKAVGI